MADLTGQTLGQYHDQRADRGAAAWRPFTSPQPLSMDRDVAIKVISAGARQKTRNSSRASKRVAHVIARLQHPATFLR